ncbi:MAG TPA: AAA domain-containing protein [Spirochaetia bacterium]|nr:AAA domain-containing protein [Spirochaetia bacterium]
MAAADGLEVFDGKEFWGAECEARPLRELMERADDALRNEDRVLEWVDLIKSRERLREQGFGEIVDHLWQREAPAWGWCGDALRYVFYSSLLRWAYAEHPELSGYTGITQNEARSRFREIDKQLLELNQREIAATLSRREIDRGNRVGPKASWTGRSLVEHEISKKKRHIPLRDLFSRAGQAMLEIKPCWMMSPSSVAQFLKPNGVTFDLLVIDEASQMKPEDAVGALARVDQAVIVGDPMQLPPTSFFERLDPDDEEIDEEEIVDNESILDAALMALPERRELLWHYRSRHESLIAFSNMQFYDSRLIVFPSPVQDVDKLGVRHVPVREGVYVPKASVNMPEAEEMLDVARECIGRYPDRSLGLVVMNQKQRDLILELWDEMSLEDRIVRQYEDRWKETLEPVFVKNLENVQGDERDNIIVGTVYGRERGLPRVKQRFGPVNSPVGHRRLNVLFTRARERTILVTSLRPSDVLVSENSSAGVRALQSYLEYAEFMRLPERAGGGVGDFDSDFEVFVAEALQRSGYDVVPQVGVDGYRIDLAVRDPNSPGRFVLGIECDGATYHSSRYARDRDRLRQEILEALGWKIHRIWSTDWFESPQRELQRLLEAVEVAARQ